MSYRWVEHTAELELEIEAATEELVFVDALSAVAELIAEERSGQRVLRRLAVEGRDRATLLSAWIDELVYLAETEDLVPGDVEQIELSDRSLEATVEARRDSPRHLVKGATYHRLAFERSDGGFRARVVLDV